jgi:hypothetical protein
MEFVGPKRIISYEPPKNYLNQKENDVEKIFYDYQQFINVPRENFNYQDNQFTNCDQNQMLYQNNTCFQSPNNSNALFENQLMYETNNSQFSSQRYDCFNKQNKNKFTDFSPNVNSNVNFNQNYGFKQNQNEKKSNFNKKQMKKTPEDSKKLNKLI